MTMCRVQNVARAGFCAWLHNPVLARDKDNQRLLMIIRDSCSPGGVIYGYRQIHADQNETGETCGKNRVGHISKLNRIKVVHSLRYHAVSPADLPLLPLIVCRGRLLLPWPIRSGSPILPIPLPGRAGCIWRWLSIPSPVSWSAGR